VVIALACAKFALTKRLHVVASETGRNNLAEARKVGVII
jgi:hypothetical protein